MSEVSPEDIGALKQAVNTLTGEVSALRRDMATVNAALAEIRGGKKVLWALLGAAGVMGAAASWLFDHLNFK